VVRWFRAGAVGLMVVAVLHTVGHFGAPPKDPGAVALQFAMDSYRYDIFGMHPSAGDITRSLSLAISIFLAFVGVLDLVAAASLAHDARALRRLAWVNVVGAGALVLLFACYRILPPIVMLAVVCALFLVCVLRPAQRRF
jgi:hypothetical protein